MSPKDRHEVQSLWAMNSIQIIVATIAFGMGIDKADVRFVVHYSLPKSLEGYYQETGRAGRDGLDSNCILYYSYSDKSKVEFLIDRGEGSYQQKQRQIESLRDVIQYCENRIDCRRTLILHYFGEVFDRQECHKTCDNCESAKEVITLDFTNAAKDLLSLCNPFLYPFVNCVVRSIMGKITLIQLVDIFRGSSAKKCLKYEKLHRYGSGKSLSRGDAERLAQTLVTQRILEEYCEANGLGFVSSYVKVGRDADALDSGKRRISMVNLVEDDSSKGRRTSDNKRSNQSGPKREPRSKNIKHALEMIKNMDDEGEYFIDDNYDYGDFRDAPSDVEIDVDENETGMNIIDNQTPEGQLKCFDQLLMLREEICIKENTTSKFLSNAMIGELSRNPPADLDTLRKLTGRGPILERHANSILKITKMYL